MYKIAINALGLKNNTGGGEAYVYNLVKSLLENDNKNKYYLFAGYNVKEIFEDLFKHNNLKPIFYKVNTNNSVDRIICENTLLPISLFKHKIDLVHHVSNYLPNFSPIKSVATLFDMVAFFYHDNYSDLQNMDKFYQYFKKAMARTAKKAERIFTISEFTRQEFLKCYDAKEKTIALPISLDTRKQIPTPNINVLEKYNINQPYLLSVSVIRPHKNFDFLVRVFNQLKEKYKIPHQLVIAGGIHFGGEKFLEEIEKSPYKETIKYVGYIKDEELSSLYSFCDAFVYPSFYEGFGIPLLEAMEYNIPVISSDRASLPEVGGDACLYFDPIDENDAFDKIYSVISNEDLKFKLINLEKVQLEKFAWDKIAKSVIDQYNTILK